MTASARRLAGAGSIALAAVLPAVPAFLAHLQGMNFLDDGLWLLGGWRLLEGDVLYRDLFAIYGPARFVLLAGFMTVMGRGALALVWLKTLTLAAASGAGFAAARRAGAGALAWIVPWGVLAIAPNKPRYLVAGLFALLVAASLRRRSGPRGWFLLGLAWGVLASFGLDMAAYGAVIWVLAVLATRGVRPDGRRLLAAAAGCSILPVILLVLGLATGALDSAVWDTIVYPATRFADEMGMSPVDTFGGANGMGVLFLEHPTGEVFAPCWPGHKELGVLANRLLYLGLLVLPPLGLWTAWRRGDVPVLAAVSAWALAGWSTSLSRGGLGHMHWSWLGTLWLLPILAAVLLEHRPRLRPAVAAVAILTLAPLAAEPLWLASRVGRPELATWERPTAGIKLTPEKIESLEVLGGLVQKDVPGPAVFWPSRPGLNFFYGVRPAGPQTTLLGGEVRDPGRLLDDLAAVPDHAVLLNLHPALFEKTTKETAPEVWAGLRRGYTLAATATGGGDDFALLRPLPAGTDIDRVPLESRLFDESCQVANALTPPLTTEFTIGQSLRVGPDPLSGIAVRLDSAAEQELVLVVRVRDAAGGTPGATLGGLRIPLRASAGLHLYRLALGPVPGTGGRNVLVDFALDFPSAAPVSLVWYDRAHESAGPVAADHYPPGAVWLDGSPRDGDLYFISY